MPIVLTIPKDEYIKRKQKNSHLIEYLFTLEDVICSAYGGSLFLEHRDPYEYFSRFITVTEISINKDGDLVIKLAKGYDIKEALKYRF